MSVAIILGNKLNDDGSITETMRERLRLALEIEKELKPEKFILSGGVANPKAGKSEAQVMIEFLIDAGVDKNKLIAEDKSLSTKQNALYSVPIVVELGASDVILCTTPEHMRRKYLNPVKLFNRRLRKYPNIILKTCCTTADILN